MSEQHTIQPLSEEDFLEGSKLVKESLKSVIMRAEYQTVDDCKDPKPAKKTSSTVNNIKSMLSDQQILKEIYDGKIKIYDPDLGEGNYDLKSIGTNSVDFKLGANFYRETCSIKNIGDEFLNPYDKQNIDRVWGPVQQPELASDFMNRTGRTLKNISPNDLLIVLSPGEHILGHTHEYIGSTKYIAAMMQTRSSFARSFVSFCKCSALANIGYFNRWTMEIINHSRYYSVILVVGRRVGQIAFFYTGETQDTSYEQNGKYQMSDNIKDVVDNWKPEQMLPKLYLDREVKYFFEEDDENETVII